MENQKSSPKNEDVELQIGGEQVQRPILPTQNEDGTPLFYLVNVKSFRKKQGRPDDQGNESWYYSWMFEIADGEFKGTILYGSTNDEARRTYTTKKPMKLLQLVTAVLGQEPGKGTSVKLSDLLDKQIRVQLEDKKGEAGEDFQLVSGFYRGPSPKGDANVENPL